VRKLQYGPGVAVRKSKRFPINSRTEERIHAPQFHKIEKAQGHAVVNWFKLSLPDRLGAMTAMLHPEFVSLEPAANPPRRDTRQP
jgi:hypothetical protein